MMITIIHRPLYKKTNVTGIEYFQSCLNKGLLFLFITSLKWHPSDGGLYSKIFNWLLYWFSVQNNIILTLHEMSRKCFLNCNHRFTYLKKYFNSKCSVHHSKPMIITDWIRKEIVRQDRASVATYLSSLEWIKNIVLLPSSDHINTTLWMHHMDADKAYREKAGRELHKNATCYTEQIPTKQQLYDNLPPISKTIHIK